MPTITRSPLVTAGAADERPTVLVQQGKGLCIAVVSNTAWNLFNFRLSLMRALQADGHRVIAVVPPDRFATRVQDAGFEYEAVRISPAGLNPLIELGSVVQLWRVLRRRRVDLVLSYTPKGNLYAAMAAIASGSEFVPNVSGLGRVFIRRSPLTWVALALYRLTFRRARHVFFQNGNDRELFERFRLVVPERAERIPGSGVDLERFAFVSPPSGRAQQAPVFLLVARMLWDKGVGEFVAAARKVRAVFPNATFKLLGDVASANPAAIPAEQVRAWCQEGIVSYVGATDDVRPYVEDADCVVLPSYREGVPRVLLEAAAMGRPVITTDAPGCRDAVIDGETGLMCRVRDAHDLAAKLMDFVGMRACEREAMGYQARAFVERHFSEDLVIGRYRHLVAACAAHRTGDLPTRLAPGIQPAGMKSAVGRP